MIKCSEINYRGELPMNYIKNIKQLPLLTMEEEHDLFTKINTGCKQSKDIVLKSNLRLVIHLAYQLRNYKVSMDDLVQEGNIGLMKAIDKFSLDHNVKFSAYASKWIKASMYEYITNNSGDIKFATTKPRRKIFFNKTALFTESGAIRDYDIVASELNVSSDDIKSYFAYSQGIGSLYNEEGEPFNIEDTNNSISNLINAEYNSYQYSQLDAALNKLPPRSIDIVKSRYSEDKIGLAELSSKYQISMERVRQIEQASLAKLKDIMVEL